MSMTSVNLRSCSQQKKTTKQVERLCASSTRLAGKKLQPKVVKKRIEHLIDREYLERDTEDATNYKYPKQAHN